MQWCNLYSSASKYNITVRKSRYKPAVYCSLAGMLGLTFLLSLTFSYVLALILTVAGIIYLSLFLSITHDSPIASSLILTNTGCLYFDKDPTSYQLLITSRLSFIGCWLIMTEKESFAARKKDAVRVDTKHFFIFRDSLSGQDFSRIARILRQLRG